MLQPEREEIMKKYMSVALVAALLVSLLAGCSLFGLSKDDVLGTWVTVKPDTQEEAMGLLENIDAYEEEIALADVHCLEYVKIVEFRENGTYYFRYDVEGTKACVRDFYDTYFNALFEGRATLEEAYGEDFVSMTQAEFRQYFATIYGYTDYIEMLDDFAQIAYDYEALEEPMETGTYSVEGDQILTTVSGEYKEEAMGAKLEDGVLTLTYVDGVEVYTKK